MKKLLTFIPLGVGISAAILYVLNIVQFRVINNSTTLMQILSNLKIYLYISVAGFITYFFVKVLLTLNSRNEPVRNVYDEPDINSSYEPIDTNVNQPIMEKQANTYVPNYDYVPVYNNTNYEEKPVKQTISEPIQDDLYIATDKESYCERCGEIIFETDVYCKRCGTKLNDKKIVNQTLRNVINVLEIVILILVLYFIISMLFDYKESKDPNFKSPLKISMTK